MTELPVHRAEIAVMKTLGHCGRGFLILSVHRIQILVTSQRYKEF